MKQSAPSNPRGGGGLNLLIADDDPISRRLLERTLQLWGYNVTTARDGDEAWKLFQERDFPLVITDWIMPGMDGLELVRRVRTMPRPGYVFIILLAAASLRREIVEGLAAGADDFVSKPFDRDELRARLRVGERIIRLEQTLVDKNRVLSLRNAEMEEDLRMACEVQQALLPQGYPSFPPEVPPERSLLRFCERYRPNGAVGGDFFDVLSISPTCGGIFICDVMGHGVRAALVAAMVRALLEGLHGSAREPGLLLAEMNRDLLSIFGAAAVPVFLTAFYCTLDTSSGKLTYANAGHPAPLIVRKHHQEVSYLPHPGGVPGAPLGVKEQTSYLTSQMFLGRGDRLLLFTDGLFEVLGADQEPFGAEQLRQAVQRRSHLPTGALFDDLLTEVVRYSAGRGFADDVCLLGVELVELKSSL